MNDGYMVEITNNYDIAISITSLIDDPEYIDIITVDTAQQLVNSLNALIHTIEQKDIRKMHYALTQKERD